MSDLIRFVERVNAVMDKEPNPHKRKEMLDALIATEETFRSILERTVQHGGYKNQ